MTKTRAKDRIKVQPNVADKAVQCDMGNVHCTCTCHTGQHHHLATSGFIFSSDLEASTGETPRKNAHHVPVDFRESVVQENAACLLDEIPKQVGKQAEKVRADKPKFLRLSSDDEHENKIERAHWMGCGSESADADATDENLESKATLERKEEQSGCSLDHFSSESDYTLEVEDEKYNARQTLSKERPAPDIAKSSANMNHSRVMCISIPVTTSNLHDAKIEDVVLKKIVKAAKRGHNEKSITYEHAQQVAAAAAKAVSKAYMKLQSEQSQFDGKKYSKSEVEGRLIVTGEKVAARTHPYLNAGKPEADRSGYSQIEVEHFDTFPVLIKLPYCKNLITRQGNGHVSVLDQLYTIAKGTFFGHIFPELGIYEVWNLGNPVFTIPRWLLNMVDDAVDSAVKEVEYNVNELSPAVNDLVPYAESRLECHLEQVLVQVRRLRRIENLLSDITYFEQLKDMEIKQKTDGQGFLVRVSRYWLDKSVPSALQASPRPFENARLVGTKWPVWTDKPLDQHASLAGFLGINDEEVLETIEHFTAGFPETQNAATLLCNRNKYRERFSTEGDSNILLKKVWYGCEASDPIRSNHIPPGVQIDRELKIAWSNLSTAEKKAVETIASL